jgi:pimeloyl-ACP methyl ester carboxylesterase
VYDVYRSRAGDCGFAGAGLKSASSPPPARHWVTKPFELHVDDAQIADLHQRLRRTRFPDQTPGAAWAYGTDLSFMRKLVTYWDQRFDWRAQEARLNGFAQYKVNLHGIDLHYLHVPGVGPAPKPLLLSHGWPGSIFEFLEMIPRLTDPARFGGDPRDAFTVIAPSLPGYGLSFTANQPRFGVNAIADCFNSLMTEVLGYSRYCAQGGDWGGFITSRLGYAYPQNLYGIHVNMLALRRDPKMFADPTPEQSAYFDHLAIWQKEETGYQWIQGTKPQTLAYGLTDSPAGLAAWIAEKFHSWTDCHGQIEHSVSLDHMLANISLYWFTGAIGSSFWPYYDRIHHEWPIPLGGKITVPSGYAEFPKEMLHPPRSLAQTVYTDLRRWTVMSSGGHFAALEKPEQLAFETTEFFRPLRNVN